jgi:catechol 2,3-dioxygenase-like lactoylglutathione lyase family enzyme
MSGNIEKISAVTLRVANMKASVQFYRDTLGMELLYGGERAEFSSFRFNDSESAILNLEHGKPVEGWGRLIFHVEDVDAIWRRFRELGFAPESPRDALWGERYFHLRDPEGHELSFAKPLKWTSEGQRLSVTVEMHNTGDADMQADVVAKFEHALADRTGDWRVPIVGSQANDRWEMKITGPNAFERSYTLEGASGEHRPEVIRGFLRKLVPGSHGWHGCRKAWKKALKI